MICCVSMPPSLPKSTSRRHSEGQRSGGCSTGISVPAVATRTVLYVGAAPIPLDPPNPENPPLTFADSGHAVAWCEAEMSNLVASVRLAADTDNCDVAYKLPWALIGYSSTFAKRGRSGSIPIRPGCKPRSNSASPTARACCWTTLPSRSLTPAAPTKPPNAASGSQALAATGGSPRRIDRLTAPRVSASEPRTSRAGIRIRGASFDCRSRTR